MIKLIFTLLFFAAPAISQVQIVEDISVCNEGDVGKWSVAAKKFVCQPVTAAPGIFTFVITGACPTGWTEDASLAGKALFGTLVANADVGTTGGSDSITPTVNSLTAAAQAFTGSSTTVPALTISWPAGVPTFAGSVLGTHLHGVGSFVNTAISAGTPAGTNGTSTVTPLGTNATSTVTPLGTVAAPTFTGTLSTVIVNHTHGLSFARGLTTGAASTTQGFTTATDASSTAIADVTNNPTAGGAANYTPAGTNNAPTFTGSSSTVGAQTFTGSSSTVGAQVFTGSALGTHNHTFSGSSEATTAGTPAGTLSWPAGVPTNATGSLTPLGSNAASAVTGTLNAFDNRSAFIKVIFCKKD